MKLTIKKKNVYGEHKYYPVCADSQIFAKIAGTKTLTRETINHIRRLGYELELEQQVID